MCTLPYLGCPALFFGSFASFFFLLLLPPKQPVVSENQSRSLYGLQWTSQPFFFFFFFDRKVIWIDFRHKSKDYPFSKILNIILMFNMVFDGFCYWWVNNLAIAETSVETLTMETILAGLIRSWQYCYIRSCIWICFITMFCSFFSPPPLFPACFVMAALFCI